MCSNITGDCIADGFDGIVIGVAAAAVLGILLFVWSDFTYYYTIYDKHSKCGN